jgi:hypothetical protein
VVSEVKPIDDLPEVREELSKLWQKACLDLIAKGFQPRSVFETLFLVGTAGWVEVHGKEAAARQLAEVAKRLDAQAAEEMAEAERAAEESRRAVKN